MFKILWTQSSRDSPHRSRRFRAFKFFFFQKLIWNIWFTFPLFFAFPDSGRKEFRCQGESYGTRVPHSLLLSLSLSRRRQSHCISSRRRAPSDKPSTLHQSPSGYAICTLVVAILNSSHKLTSVPHTIYAILNNFADVQFSRWFTASLTSCLTLRLCVMWYSNWLQFLNGQMLCSWLLSHKTWANFCPGQPHALLARRVLRTSSVATILMPSVKGLVPSP